MKDGQTDLASQPNGFAILGWLLHCLAMPAALCLRTSFGHLFLRPRSIFLSFSLAFTLLFIVAWQEPELWMAHGPACSLAFAISCLYVFYLIAAFWKQNRGIAEHDLYTGYPHALRIVRAFGASYSGSLEINIKQWGDPAFLAAAALMAKQFIGDRILSTCLFVLAGSLWANEFRVYWYWLRKKKRLADLRDDTEGEAEQHSNTPIVEAPKGMRKPKRDHRRHSQS